MQVDRHVELFGARIDRPEPLVVEEFAVGHAVQHGALEAELGDAALELVGRGRRIVGRQAREGGEARRIGGDRRMQPVVDPARQRHRDVGGDLLRRRRAVGEHLHVDAGLVHLLDAQRAEIEQALVGLARPPGFDAGEMGGHLRVPVVLLDRDHRTLRLVQHVRCVSLAIELRLSYRGRGPAPSSVSPNLLWCRGQRPPGHRQCGERGMLVFNLEREQEWNPKKHVEKILGRVGGGDVTVACWEPGQISPYHCHPDATEIYFCFSGGGQMRTPERRGRGDARQLRGASAGRAARIRQRPQAHAAVPRALRRRHGGALPRLARAPGMDAIGGRRGFFREHVRIHPMQGRNY